MTTTPNMSLVLPTPGGDSGTWDDLLNAALTLVDAHDHTTGKGPQVPASGLNIDGDLTMHTHSLTSIASLDFAETTIASGARRLFFSSADHELYVRTNGGTNIKVTSGSTLNLSLVGGIVGDYASVGAEVAYDDANDRYTFKQQLGGGGVKQWARLAAGDVDLYEVLATASGTTISNRVRLKSPSGLASSYAVTWPAAVPATPATVLPVQMDGNGTLTVSSTLQNLTVTAAATLTGGATCGTDANLTLSGTGDYKHGDKKLTLDAISGVALVGTWTIGANYNPGSSTSSDVWGWSVPLKVGDRIKSIIFYGDRQSTGTLTFALQKRTLSTGAISSVSSGTISAGTGAVNVTVSSINYTLVDTETPILTLTSGGGGSSVHRASAAIITFDRP